MTKQFARYESYKDSGVEWLGQVPANWEIKRVKSLFRLIVEPAPVNNQQILLSLYTDIGVKPRSELEERGNKASTTDGYLQVKKDDIVVNKLLAWMGAVGISNYDGVTSPAYDIIRPFKQINSVFYHYLFRNQIFVQEMKRYSRGIMDMRLRLYFDKFGEIFLPVPTFQEQVNIVRYIEKVEAQIDEAIAQKEKMIELLKEYRQVTINNAVTKGLEPNVPMKDSGIAWLGQIPAHWEVKKIKHITIKIGSGITPSGGGVTYLESGVPLLRSQNVLFGKLEFEGVAFISQRTHASMVNSQVRNGDVLLNITGGSIGRCHFVEIDNELNVNQHVCIVRPSAAITTIFLNTLLSSQIGQSQIWYYQQGGGREGLNFQAIKNFFVSLPPKSEQLNISNHIKEITLQFTTAISLKQQEIEKLKEYKGTLIDSAVTGKIKV